MLNNISIQGRLVAEPNLKQTASGTSVCSFRIACKRSYTPKGQEQQTDFFNIVTYSQTAEFVCKYFHKGSTILANGRIQSRDYEGKDGNKHTVVEIIASEINFCGDLNKSNDEYRGGANYAQNAQNHADFAPVQDDEDLPF